MVQQPTGQKEETERSLLAPRKQAPAVEVEVAGALMWAGREFSGSPRSDQLCQGLRALR